MGQSPCAFLVGQRQPEAAVLQQCGDTAGSRPCRAHRERKPFLLLPRMCLKSQLVDLKAEGYWDELLDTFRPEIEVKDW